MSNDELFTDPEAARRDSRFSAVLEERTSRHTAKEQLRVQYEADRAAAWRTSLYLQKLLRDLTALRDEAAEKAGDAAGVARWKALHDVVKRLDADRAKAEGKT